MDILAGFADIFRQRGYKSGNVMMGFGFDFMDAFYRKSSFFADFLRRFLWDVPQFSLGFAGQDFYFFHSIPFIVFSPDLTHFFFCITFYHEYLSFEQMYIGNKLTLYYTPSLPPEP